MNPYVQEHSKNTFNIHWHSQTGIRATATRASLPQFTYTGFERNSSSPSSDSSSPAVKHAAPDNFDASTIFRALTTTQLIILKSYPCWHRRGEAVLTGLKKGRVSAQPNSTDLRPWRSEVKDHESLDSCTANAGIGLIEHHMHRAFSKHINGSRLFLYKTTRVQLVWTGTAKALPARLALNGKPRQRRAGDSSGTPSTTPARI